MAVESFTSSDKLYMTLLIRIQQLESDLEDIRAQAVQAAIMPRQAAGGMADEDDSSFCFKKIDGANFYIYGGSVLWASWPAYNLPDDTFVTINGGTAEAPGCVALRLEWSLGPTLGTTLQFVNSANPPVADGTYGWKPLYQAWLVDGVAVCGRSKRHDLNITVPIGAA